MSGEPLTLMAVGDVNIQRADAATIFGDTVDVLKEADVLFGNQEGVASDAGSPLQGKREIGSSCVRGSVGAIAAQADIGFSAMSLANNHSMDYGPDALVDSLDRLHQHGIATAGAGRNTAEAHAPAIVTPGNTRIAMLAYTSVFPRFGFVATAYRPGVAAIHVSTAYETPDNVPYQPGTPATTVTIPSSDDARAMEADIRVAKEQNDLVVVQFHWGVVGAARPLGYMRELGRAAVDAGADLVLGHHPHVLHGVEVYNDVPICYSLNHFAFEHGNVELPPWPHVHDTIIVTCSIDAGRIVNSALAVATIDPKTHQLAMASDAQCLAVAEHLDGLSAEFSTSFELSGDRLLVRGPSATKYAPPRAPDVYVDPSTLVADTRRVVARSSLAQSPGH